MASIMTISSLPPHRLFDFTRADVIRDSLSARHCRKRASGFKAPDRNSIVAEVQQLRAYAHLRHNFGIR